MSSYAALAANAEKTLTKKGRVVTRRIYTTGTYDPATGAAAVTSTDDSRKGVILSFGAGQTTIRGTLIQGTDKRLLLDAIGDAPQGQDHFLVGADEYSVVSIDEVNPAGIPVLYDLHLRK